MNEVYIANGVVYEDIDEAKAGGRTVKIVNFIPKAIPMPKVGDRILYVGITKTGLASVMSVDVEKFYICWDNEEGTQVVNYNELVRHASDLGFYNLSR
jgi:hypothetical protein